MSSCENKVPYLIELSINLSYSFLLDLNGLKAGVQILEVNNIDFERITVASALLVLQGTDRIRMKIMYARPIRKNQREIIHQAPVPAAKDTTTTW